MKHYRKKTRLHLGILCALTGLLFLFQLQDFAFAVCSAIAVSAGLVDVQKNTYKV